MKIQKKNLTRLCVWGGGGGGVRVDVNEELKFLGNSQKKIGEGGDVNPMLGVGGDVRYGRCEPRIEGIVQCTKWYCTILRKLKNMGGGGGRGRGNICTQNTLYAFKKEKEKKSTKKNWTEPGLEPTTSG